MQRVGKMAAAVQRELHALKGAMAFQPVASPELSVLSRAGVVHHLPPLQSAPLGGDEWRAALAR
jgi:hypothetical protein